MHVSLNSFCYLKNVIVFYVLIIVIATDRGGGVEAMTVFTFFNIEINVNLSIWSLIFFFYTNSSNPKFKQCFDDNKIW